MKKNPDSNKNPDPKKNLYYLPSGISTWRHTASQWRSASSSRSTVEVAEVMEEVVGREVDTPTEFNRCRLPTAIPEKKLKVKF